MERFEEEFEKLLEEQKATATGQRSEMLNRNLTGTKLLLKNLLLPVFGKSDGIVLEYEMKGPSGVMIFGDAGLPSLRIIVEEDHFVTHAEKVTRDRFSFERARARSVAVNGFVYFPFSRDELEKKPEESQRSLYELLGRIGTKEGTGLMKLPVYERELLRCAWLRGQTFRLGDVSEWLLLGKETCRKIIAEMQKKELVCSVGGSPKRCYEFHVSEKALQLLLKLI
ncbi:hypothetical protein [Cohnella sp.]|uniref:hypothetical protein n=1 Tax=Cohnella sp. TaxID=1883426 RepID=UPI003566ED5B